MSRPETIYLPPSDAELYDEPPRKSDVRYTRHDLHEAALAERDELRKEVERLTNIAQRWREEFPERAIEWRGIEPENICNGRGGCGGTGQKVYGSTATWRGGIGGQAITADVCDKCWGSGNKSNPWPSHRTMHNLQRDNDRLRARLDASMEWLPIAEADLRDGEHVVFGVGEVYWTGRYDRNNPPAGFSHVMRIKPPKAPGEV